MANKEKMGISNIEEVFDALLVFIKTGKEKLGDGFQLEDSFAIFSVILGPQIQAAFKDADRIGDEIDDMDAAERREFMHKLVDFGNDVFDVFSKKTSDGVLVLELEK